MKGLYIALMVVSIGGCIALIELGFGRHDACDTLGAIAFWFLSMFVAGLAWWSFRQGAKIGQEEDDVRRAKDAEILNIIKNKH
ncbi:hypothetical protein ACFLVS_02125 [Chloroflexota bacterium]